MAQDFVVPVQCVDDLGMDLQELVHLLVVIAVLAGVAAKLLVRASIPDRSSAREAFPSCFLFDLVFHPVPVQRLAPDPRSKDGVFSAICVGSEKKEYQKYKYLIMKYLFVCFLSCKKLKNLRLVFLQVVF